MGSDHGAHSIKLMYNIYNWTYHVPSESKLTCRCCEPFYWIQKKNIKITIHNKNGMVAHFQGHWAFEQTRDEDILQSWLVKVMFCELKPILLARCSLWWIVYERTKSYANGRLWGKWAIASVRVFDAKGGLQSNGGSLFTVVMQVQARTYRHITEPHQLILQFCRPSLIT